MYSTLILFLIISRVQCSILGDNKKVIFGFNSEPGCHKHMAAVTITVPGFGVYGCCSGSLVSSKFVITAAHCCNSNFVLYVTLGAQDLSLPFESSRQQFIVNNQFIHPNFTGLLGNYHYGDICLLQLNTTAVLNGCQFNVFIADYVNKINLCSPVSNVNNDTYIYRSVRVSGYGGNSSDSPTPNNFVNYYGNWIVPFGMANSIFKMYAELNLLQEYHLCTLNGPSSCFGDSGGSMTLQTYQNGTNSYCLLAIVSFGLASCGYASCSERLDTPNTQQWINTVIVNNS